MERIEKRMGKMKKGKWLCQNDDKDDEEDEEEDELVEDEDEDENENDENVAPGVGGRNWLVRKGLWTIPVESEPPDWDPFGDEEEL
jgi:hypothetical protein